MCIRDRLETDERDRIKGLVINKFRGDVEILRPGLSMLEDKTHLPVLGVVPYLRVDIEDEDSLSERLSLIHIFCVSGTQSTERGISDS